jgi:AcrR family transcriptional regulator
MHSGVLVEYLSAMESAMPARSDKPRKKLLAVTVKLLEKHDPEGLTVREIAAAAKMAPGQINYHYGSRDALVHEAVSERLRVLAANMLEDSGKHGSPRELLRHMLRVGASFGMDHAALMETTVKQALTGGDLGAVNMIEPLVADILGAGSAQERRRARLLGFQLFMVIQAAFLNRDELRRYCGFDFADDEQRNAFLDQLLERYLPEVDAGTE